MKKWKPSANQRKQFALNMQDPDFANDYYKRKELKALNRRSKSSFDYETAGGYYVPTKAQYDFAFNNDHLFFTLPEIQAKNEVLTSYSNNMKTHHDFIHIINEKMRNQN
jgi:hypothetical protein